MFMAAILSVLGRKEVSLKSSGKHAFGWVDEFMLAV